MSYTYYRDVLIGYDLKRSVPPEDSEKKVCIKGLDIYGKRSEMGINTDSLYKGILACGATGSGKTYLCKELSKQLRLNLTDKYSMIIVQAKNDFNSLIRREDMTVSQGKDSETSIRWNIFRDIMADGNDKSVIELNTRELVAHLFADKKEQKEQFFVIAARELLYCVIISFINEAEHCIDMFDRLNNGGLRDYFLTFKTDDYKWILEKSGESGVLRMLLGENTDNLQGLGVLGEMITTVLNVFTDVFAESGDFSIRQFVKEKKNRCLFINYDPNYKEIQIPIYNTLISLALKEVLSRDVNDGDTILVCDELPTMGKTNLDDAVNLGRAKRLITYIGIQSITQLYSLYGENDAKKFLAGLSTQIYMKPNDLVTREYMKESFGKVIADCFQLSPGGTRCERKEEYALDDESMIGMKTGDCYIIPDFGEPFYFHVG